MTTDQIPEPLQDWMQKLPQQCVGDLYATIKDPVLGIPVEYKVPTWGQLCDGRDHKDAVHLMLYNRFLNHGKGFTYISWRAVPNNPEQNNYPRTGLVTDPKPYSGVAYE